MINNCLSDLSCNVHEFTKAKSIYETTLKESGYETALSYKKNPPKQRNRIRRVMWFNPPYNKNLQTNIGKIFLNLVKKHFNRNHKYAKIVNQSTLKLRCTLNAINFLRKYISIYYLLKNIIFFIWLSSAIMKLRNIKHDLSVFSANLGFAFNIHKKDC